MMAEKLHPLSRVTQPKIEMDTVKRSMQFDCRRGFDVLLQAQQAWGNMDKFRIRRGTDHWPHHPLLAT